MRVKGTEELIGFFQFSKGRGKIIDLSLNYCQAKQVCPIFLITQEVFAGGLLALTYFAS
jgi:hypothetical protein